MPLGFSVYYSPTDWAGYGDHERVGLENYRTILTGDPVFWRSLRNVLALRVVTITVQNPVQLACMVIVALPALALYLFFSKHIMAGATAAL